MFQVAICKILLSPVLGQADGDGWDRGKRITAQAADGGSGSDHPVAVERAILQRAETTAR